MQTEYIRRINKVLQYIEEHLDEELSLSHIADVAFYSPYHLHRLFRAITNETLNSYITRKRIERAAILLVHHKELNIADIAKKCGFINDSTFTRTFKKIYNQSPSAFRNTNAGNLSKIGKENGNNGQLHFITEEYLRNINELKKWIAMNAQIEIKNLPTQHLAYVTHIGVDGLENAFQRILQWAIPKGLLAQPNTSVCRVFHDSFKITDADKVRMSVGIASPSAMQAEAEIGITTLPKGKHIVGRFEIEPVDFEKSWNSLFIWMNENGYKKSAAFPFELYHNNYMDHPEKKCIVDLVIPVE